jgi:epoxyqueuosine reductase
MNGKETYDKLKEMAFGEGIDLFRIADADCFLDSEYEGNRPQDFLEDVRSVIIIGSVVPNGVVDPLPKGRSQYTNTLMAATALLRVASFKLARFIERTGHWASIVPNEGSEFGYWYADKDTLRADLSVKWAAYCAGMGNYSINQLLITPEYGPRVRLTAILTDMVLDYDGKSMPLISDACGDCRRCIQVCPVQAIHEDGTFERFKCKEYMFSELGGLRCGLCLKVCPPGSGNP